MLPYYYRSKEKLPILDMGDPGSGDDVPPLFGATAKLSGIMDHPKLLGPLRSLCHPRLWSLYCLQPRTSNVREANLPSLKYRYDILLRLRRRSIMVGGGRAMWRRSPWGNCRIILATCYSYTIVSSSLKVNCSSCLLGARPVAPARASSAS